MSLDGDGNIVVRAPYVCTKGTIDRFVRENEGWISRHREKLKRSAAEAEAEGRLTAEEIHGLAEAMKRVLPGKLAHFAELAGVTYGRVTIRNQKSKWGSCSNKGNLNFNCLLMLAPEEVLDYVIVHELCHRRHMDHSKEFWKDVERVIPDYKERKKWLTQSGGMLMKRMIN